jgi:phosphoribosylanthranilate isomerase
MKLKVCGMRDKENIKELLELEPAYMGFIFWGASSRYVSETTDLLPKSIKKTGVFVDATTDYIQMTVKEQHLDAVQLHGNESAAYCDLISEFGVEVIKAFSVNDLFDFSILSAYESFCDYFLFDTKGELPGGNGIGFNWKVLGNYPSEKPFFLSGGIGPDDIEKIKQLIKTGLPLFAVDVNSKFELSPGEKNIEIVNAFKKQLDEL